MHKYMDLKTYFGDTYLRQFRNPHKVFILYMN